MTSRVPTIRSNPLLYPAGRSAGFDATHIAASQCYYSLVARGNRFLTVQGNIGRPTITGTAPTAFIDGNIGPSCVLSTTTQHEWTPTLPVGGSQTLATIYRPTASPTNNTFCSANDVSNNGVLLSINAGAVQMSGGGGSVTSTITLAINIPYFIVGSNNTTTCNILVKNLRTGVTQFFTAAGFAPGASSVGFVDISGAGRESAAMYSGVFLSQAEMQAWAADPWSFWYPRVLDLTTSRVGAAASGSVATATGAGTATGVGISTATSTGTVAGVGIASGKGASTATATATAAGTGTATGVGISTATAIASASGTGIALAIGISTATSIGSSSGVGTATGIGISTATSVATSSGLGTASGVGASEADSVGTSSGTGTATGVGSSGGTGSTGTATGQGSASGVGASTAEATATFAGQGTASGVGISTATSAATSSGQGTAIAVGVGVSLSTGTIAGLSTVTGIGSATATSVGLVTDAFGIANGVSISTATSVGISIGTGTATGFNQSPITTPDVGGTTVKWTQDRVWKRENERQKAVQSELIQKAAAVISTLGGHARAASLTANQRSKIASNAAKARWK